MLRIKRHTDSGLGGGSNAGGGGVAARRGGGHDRRPGDERNDAWRLSATQITERTCQSEDTMIVSEAIINNVHAVIDHRMTLYVLSGKPDAQPHHGCSMALLSHC